MSSILSVLTGPLLDISNLFHGKIRELGADGLIGMLLANAVISLTMVEKNQNRPQYSPLRNTPVNTDKLCRFSIFNNSFLPVCS